MSRPNTIGHVRRRQAFHRTGLLARAEGLERRTLLATLVVNDAGDSGPGTLRQAILDANTLTGPDTITFNIPGGGSVRTIRPLAQLPDVAGQTTIEGRSQAGVTIELDGSLAGPAASGLVVTGSNSIVRGLVINRFAGHGVVAGFLTAGPRPGPAPTGIRIESNLIGTDVTGNVDLGNGGAGVVITSGGAVVGTMSSTVTAARNVVSGNGFAGVWVTGGALTTSFQGPSIAGNYIGTNAAGSRALGNGREGILVEAGSLVQIGSPAVAARNVISGNAGSGIRLGGTSVTAVQIVNNYIGTDSAGAGAIPNGWSASLPFHDGITIAASNITSLAIGGSAPATTSTSLRNLISGNAGAGVNVVFGGEVHVIGNYIGTDATGNADLGNGSHGVLFQGGATGTPFGGAYGRINGNLISGNGGDGVRMAGRLAVPIGGNYIGTNATGTSALGNDSNGVTIDTPTVTSQVGAPGPTPAPSPTPQPVSPTGTSRNLISANHGHGILVTIATRTGGAAVGVVNNYVGTDFTGTVPLGNGGSGVYITATNVTVGAPSFTSGGNLISANGGNGVTIVGTPGTQSPIPGNNRLTGNRIGVAAPDTRVPSTVPDPGTNTSLGNHGHGVAIFYSASNRVGSGTADNGNVIAYNDGAGVLVEGGAGTTPTAGPANLNLITANSIYGNGGLGIDLSLSGEGVTPNDPLDADEGPNRLQNFPTINEAVASPTGTSAQIRFTVTGRPSTSVRVEFFSSPLADPSGYGEGRRFLGMTNVSLDSSGSGSGTFMVSGFNATTGLVTSQYFTATATDSFSPSGGNTSEFSPAVRGTPAPPPPTPQANTTVTERRVFYKDSAFDGNTAAGSTRYLSAIAADKRPLLPGQVASFENVTSYDKGINGIELLFFNPSFLQLQLMPDDLGVRVGTSADRSTWVAGPAPASVEIVPIPGPNTMYAVTWADRTLRNTWVEVTVKANADSGLAAPDVFYFGNLVGETGDAATPLRVSALDLAGTKGHFTSDAPITSRYDFNRDGAVNALDLAAVRANYGRSLVAIVAPPPPPDGVAEPTPLASITEQVLG